MSSVSGEPKIKVTEGSSLTQELNVGNKVLKNLYLPPHPGYPYPDFYISFSRAGKMAGASPTPSDATQPSIPTRIHPEQKIEQNIASE